MLETPDHKLYVIEDGMYFRMYEFVPDTMTFESSESDEMIENAASAFGKFHKNLAGLDGSKLGETIPFFHDTSKRYQDFLEAVNNDKAGRAKDVEYEINEVKKYASYYSMVVDGIKNGDIMGWNLDNGLIEPYFNACITENDEPCIVFDITISPKYDFDKLI